MDETAGIQAPTPAVGADQAPAADPLKEAARKLTFGEQLQKVGSGLQALAPEQPHVRHARPIRPSPSGAMLSKFSAFMKGFVNGV